ncbi:carbohydrate ABC transporter substrate-binding protein (CUT1 family) [Azospirillum brasilense]|uniref:Carbohydrate ABC transporter substrate-binding protein (CUT1 family) n=1 Tax=Azospirillum brasilense TaxID=192 RepID=A0A560BJ97_AZOBR|nr:ABC transporter substrate-binding protein [Azospirillum brasilense]TWA72687.1 carbohydrate ABC transporter substrate-binding protein (CUT1 family) [Azospirillum brasilense]
MARRWARRRALLLAGMLTAVSALPAAGATVTLACSGLGISFDLCRDGAQEWARRSGNEVRFVSPPKGASEQLALYQQLLAAGSPDIDVFQIDVVWPGILGNYFIDLKERAGAEAVGRHLPAMIEAATVKGRLVAMPWFADAGVLYARKDLLEAHGRPVPETWEQLQDTAALIQRAERAAGRDRMWGYVWQGRAYEGLTVNALEWIASRNGGTIVAPDGAITIDNPQAAEALAMARGWVGSISPPGVLNYMEEEARGVFQSGNAVFMRNWPYAWTLVNATDSAVGGKVAVVPLPKGGPGGRHTSTLGGQLLAVSKFSAHADEAADLALYLTGVAEQKRRAIHGASNPTIPALYEDAEVLAANPFFAALAESIANAVNRPAQATGMRYNQVSAEFYANVHEVLTGRQDAKAMLPDLKEALVRISRGGRW